MAIAWSRRILSTTIPPPDRVFTKNFMKEFLEQLKKENPSAGYLNTFIPKYLASIDNPSATQNNGVDKLTKLTLAKLRTSFLTKKQRKKP